MSQSATASSSNGLLDLTKTPPINRICLAYWLMPSRHFHHFVRLTKLSEIWNWRLLYYPFHFSTSLAAWSMPRLSSIQLSDGVPIRTLGKKSHHYRNLFQAPVLFHAMVASTWSVSAWRPLENSIYFYAFNSIRSWQSDSK